MWQVPERMWLTSGIAEGETELNAFDNALLRAGIANYNLIKVSSIAPANVVVEEDGPPMPAGTLVPVVLAKAVSSVPGEVISSCVGVGFSKHSHGMIMEYSGVVSPDEAEEVVRRMVKEAFARRDLDLDKVLVKSCQHRVEKVGCTVAAVVLW